ncbi:two-component sensor histidine kinase [Labrys miyagiensis]|uniref:histidine kinase n=2 Tax=Labrys miyagiensis TaxID=346912 RepID=A0ABQ6CVP2_9HYPH|nr:two-component sensor histidine kinase [Labrys miyagiensis]
MGSNQTIMHRIWGRRWLVAAIALVLAVLALWDGISAWHGVAALAMIIAAAGLVPPTIAQDGNSMPVHPDNGGKPSFEDLVAAIPDPVIVLDANLAVRFFNRKARDIIPNLRISEALTYALRVPELIDAIRAALDAGGSRQIEYSERVPVDRMVEAQISTITGPSGRTDFVVIVLRDVTQRQRVEQMRVDFVANASHELRTPLASLLGFVETLQGPARNDPVAREKFLDIMRAQANRMSRLIDDLLSLSRIELNAHVQPDKPVDLNMVVGHVADTLGPLAHDRGVVLSVDKRIPSLEVRGERDELIRVFENLVENAIKYGASGGRVEVILDSIPKPQGKGLDAVVTVRDFGPGIEAEHVPRLTERFYRVDAAKSREKGGTGLGLAIVKHIVARHRGRLGIESVPGEGTVFSVKIDQIL